MWCAARFLRGMLIVGLLHEYTNHVFVLLCTIDNGDADADDDEWSVMLC